MKAVLLTLAIVAAIAASSFISHEIGYRSAARRAEAAKFYDTYRAAIWNGYFVARGRGDAYFWSVHPIVSRYSDFLAASEELGISADERKKNEILIARYYYGRGESIPAETAALLSSIPARETFTLPEVPSPERLRSAMDTTAAKK